MTIKTIEDAILAINPDAVFTNTTPDNTSGINWREGTAPIAAETLEAKKAELQTAEDEAVAKKATDKANAKAKLITGEPLTEDEADTIVL
tara:strand:- start:173 stop:442 length:270 start_codon:yes stop_codon:yes gene_type:complete